MEVNEEQISGLGLSAGQPLTGPLIEPLTDLSPAAAEQPVPGPLPAAQATEQPVVTAQPAGQPVTAEQPAPEPLPELPADAQTAQGQPAEQQAADGQVSAEAQAAYEQQMAEYERQMAEYNKQQAAYEQQQKEQQTEQPQEEPLQQDEPQQEEPPAQRPDDAGDFPPLTQEYELPVNPKPKPKLKRTGAKPVIKPLINTPEGDKPKPRRRRSAGVRFTPPSGAQPIVRSAADIDEGTEDGTPTAENPSPSRRRITKSRIALFIDIDGTNITRDNLEELFYSITARQEILFAKIYGYGQDKTEFDDIIQKYNVQTTGKLDSKANYGNKIDPRVLLDAYECAAKNKSVLDTVFVWCAPCELSYMFERIIKLGVATSTIDNPYFDCNNQWTSTKIKLFSPYNPVAVYGSNYAYDNPPAVSVGEQQMTEQQTYEQQMAEYERQMAEYNAQVAAAASAEPEIAPAPEQPVYTEPAYTPAPAAEQPVYTAPVEQPAAPEPTPAPAEQPAYAPAPEQSFTEPAPAGQLNPEQMTQEQIAEQMPWLVPENPPQGTADMPQGDAPQMQQPQQDAADDFEPEPEGVEIHMTEGFGSEADMDKPPPESEEDNRMMVIDMMKEMGMDFGQQGGGDAEQMAGMMGEDTGAAGNLDDI